MVVLVIGATGTVGKPAVEALLKVGAKVRVLARSKDTAYKAFGDAVEIIEGDYSAIITNSNNALSGVDKALIITQSTPNQPELEGKLTNSLKQAGTPHVVKLSAYGASPIEPTSSLFYWHYEAEQNIIKSGLPYTILRPNLFIQNFPREVAPTVSSKDAIFSSVGNGRVSLIDVRDIADVAAVVLTTSGHEGRTYELTGPEDLTFSDVAAKLTETVGRPIKFVAITDAQLHHTLTGLKFPDDVVHLLVVLYQFYRKDRGAGVIGNTEILLGRPARSVDSYIKENVALFAKQQ